jgi:S-methylmethionine-dependent homocysteine/selenocysteine methylase
MIEEFGRRLAAGEVVLLDGGTGTELEARGVPVRDGVWSSLASLDDADVLRVVHEDYIRAGAEIIIANTFAANRLVLEPAGLGERVADINTRAVEIAVQARENAAERPVLVAGSLTPLGTEEDPDPDANREHVLGCFREQVALQADAGVDLFALEMIPSILYGSAAAQAAREAELPVLLGVTAGWSGEIGPAATGSRALSSLVKELAGPGVIAVAAMHTQMDDVGATLDEIERGWPGAVGAYPHHGDWNPPHWVFHDIPPERLAAAATGWVGRGVQLIGGCCGIRPSHIALLRQQLPTHIPGTARRSAC